MEALNDLMVGLGLLVTGVCAAIVLTFVVNLIGRKFNNGDNIINIDLF